MSPKRRVTNITDDLKERAKELSCLYEVQELLNDKEKSLDEVFHEIINILPHGWQYPDICKVQVFYRGTSFQSDDFKKSKWSLKANIVVQDDVIGAIHVYYTEKRPSEFTGLF